METGKKDELNKNYEFSQFNFYKILVNDSEGNPNLCCFKSIDDILILLYSNRYNVIRAYNLSTFQIIQEIKNFISHEIRSIKHYFDQKEKRDLILTVDDSLPLKVVKVWNYKKWECLYTFNVNCYGLELRLINFINNKNQILIFINRTEGIAPNQKDYREIYDINGKKIREINYEGYIKGFNSFYDETLCKTFIIIGSDDYALSYDFNEDKEYKKYKAFSRNSFYNILIKKDKEKYELITFEEKNIVIWDFHSGNFIKNINLNFEIESFCLLNNRYIVIGSYEKIVLFDLKEEKEIKDTIAHGRSEVGRIFVFNHPKFGECLVTRSVSQVIKLWIIKNDNSLS